MLNYKSIFSKKTCFLLLKTILLGVTIVLIFLLIPKVNAVITSLDNMEKLLKTQYVVMKRVNASIPEVKDYSSRRILRKFVQRCEKEHYRAVQNVRGYVENPINAFTLIGRLSRDLDIAEDILKLKENTNYTKNHRLTYVSETDQEDISRALLHLAKAYNLKVTDLSNGILRSNYNQIKEKFVEIVSPMTSSDCHDLALAAFGYAEYEMSHSLMSEALRKYKKDCDTECTFDKTHITKFLNQVTIKMKKSKGRNETIERLHALCRDEGPKKRSLTCQYRYGPHPFLRLARLKTELLHVDPDITMFHDVISDDEIAGILKLAAEKSKYSTTDQDYRFTKTPIYDEQSSVVTLVSLKVLDMTGLSHTIVDGWEAVTYGVAGFEANVDYSATEYPSKVFRDTTVLFYLSEVSQGGATVFTRLGLTVFPVKKSAVIWSNLLPSGQINPMTEYATCPVLHGTKCVTMEWFYDNESLNTCIENNPREPEPDDNSVSSNDQMYSKGPEISDDTEWLDGWDLSEFVSKLPDGLELPEGMILTDSSVPDGSELPVINPEPSKFVNSPLSYESVQRALHKIKTQKVEY